MGSTRSYRKYITYTNTYTWVSTRAHNQIRVTPRKSKKNVQQASYADLLADVSAPAALTPEQIFTALVQLLEGQCKTQQQVEALLAQQSNPQLAESQPGSTKCDRETTRPLQGTHHTEDARDVINNRRSTREEGRDRANRVSGQDRLARIRGNLRHIIN